MTDSPLEHAGASPASPHVASVRKRPGMYVGNAADGTGLHTLVIGLVHRALNWSRADAAWPRMRVGIVLHADGAVTVCDDLGDLAVRPDMVLRACTDLHVRVGRFPIDLPREQWLPETDLCIVNALSSWMTVAVWHDGRRLTARFANGIPTAEPCSVPCGGSAGTRVMFQPEPAFFGSTAFEFDRLERQLFPLVWLCPSLTISLTDERPTPARVLRLNGHAP